MQEWSKTASRGDFPGKVIQKVIWKWFWSDFKLILVAKMEQNSFQRIFSWKNHPKSDFKVILTWFQSDFSCKNGAKQLPEEIFLENSSKKWFQSDFESDFKVILVARMEQNSFQRRFSWKSHPKSDLKVILKWFQIDFSCKNGAKQLPEDIFLKKSSKKWFQSDFDVISKWF